MEKNFARDNLKRAVAAFVGNWRTWCTADAENGNGLKIVLGRVEEFGISLCLPEKKAPEENDGEEPALAEEAAPALDGGMSSTPVLAPEPPTFGNALHPVLAYCGDDTDSCAADEIELDKVAWKSIVIKNVSNHQVSINIARLDDAAKLQKPMSIVIEPGKSGELEDILIYKVRGKIQYAAPLVDTAAKPVKIVPIRFDARRQTMEVEIRNAD